MTKIEALAEIISQSNNNCCGINCRECPFDADPEQLMRSLDGAEEDEE
jgi:hypothetical protein